MKYFITYIVIINIIAFIMYGRDKRKAIQGAFRTPERILIGVAIIGGSVGAYAGMHMFHHKTKHAKFFIGVPLIIIVQAISFFLALKAHLLPGL